MYSFDIFDTLITRNTATPSGIFALMQEQLHEDLLYCNMNDYLKDNFVLLRQNAEFLARKNAASSGAEDVSLEEVYDAFRLTGQIDEHLLERIKSLELKTEKENVVGISDNIQWLKELLARGEHVVLISDMYLSSDIIKEMLLSVDECFRNITIYVSSEWGKNKASGNLYQIVKEQEHIADYKEWTHIGDNEHSDYFIPKQMGIAVKRYRYETLLPWESKALSNSEDNAGKQLMIGAARNIRLLNKPQKQELIGASIGGAILYPYVAWILKEAEEKNIRRIYFIARDGYILKKIADILIEERKINIQTCYIYGSRIAWRVPSFNEETIDIYKLFQWSHSGNIVCMEDVAEILQISYEQLEPFLPWGCRNRNHNLSQSSLFYLIRHLSEDEQFIKSFLEIHKKQHALVVEYLKQEVDVSDEKFAFVELGGGGYTQGCFANLMKEITAYPTRTFYYKMDRMHVVDNCSNYVFFPSYMSKNLVLEMICRAPHGQTEGYGREEGKIVPILREDESKYLVQYGYEEYIQGIVSFTRLYSSTEKQLNGHIYIDLMVDYLKYVSETPDVVLLEFFSQMPNTVTGREKEPVAFAPALTAKQLRELFLWDGINWKTTKYSGSDIAYSLLRCSEKQTKKIKRYQALSKSKIGLAVKKRIGDKDRKDILSNIYEYPFDMLGEKIVLYGAGKYGKLLYDGIKKNTQSDVVLWVDKRYEELTGYAMKIVSPKEISYSQYNQVVLTVQNRQIAEAIKKELIEMGIPESKIVWFPYERKVITV